jgi:hypothetical protein
MSCYVSRRDILQAAAGAGAWLGLLRSGAGAGPQAVSLPAGIEPLVRLIEETPRERVIEAVAERVRSGVEYADVLAALMLAGVRNVEPRPSVGFKFHAVLVIQSIHLAYLAADPVDRWLPVFWGIDYFKYSQIRDERERGWTMVAVDESAVPAASQAKEAFAQAMDQWDEGAADAAVAALARTAQPTDTWELLFRYGARDYRSIGHKAIDVANSHRVLGVIGWKHAEPILRSLAYALLMHEDGNPAERDAWPDQPGRRNLELVDRLPENWHAGKANPDATKELLNTLRDGSEDEAADRVVELLRRGIGPQSIWDGLFLAAGELLIRQPGIIALHSVTTTNALHYAYRFAQEDHNRRLILLQNASFLPMFRKTMHQRGKVRDFRLDAMESADAGPQGQQSVDAIFAHVRRNPMAAAEMTLAYFRGGASAKPWVERAQKLIIRKGTGAHDFKFGFATLEDLDYVSEKWRPYHAAASVFQLQGASQPENPLVHRIRRALDSQ